MEIETTIQILGSPDLPGIKIPFPVAMYPSPGDLVIVDGSEYTVKYTGYEFDDRLHITVTVT